MRILIVGLFFISCSTKHNINIESIQGDWIFIKSQGVGDLGLRFERDKLYTIRGGEFFLEGRFSIIGDTILINEYGNKVNKNRQIIKLTKDSLIISNGATNQKYYSRRLEFNDSLKLNQLSILAGNCFGNCPQFSLKLTGNGLIHFKPIRDCKVTNEKDFILDRKAKSKIDTLFKWTFLQKLDTSKIDSALDDWTIVMRIDYNNGQKTEFRTTHSNIPFRLKGIYEILINSLTEKRCI